MQNKITDALKTGNGNVKIKKAAAKVAQMRKALTTNPAFKKNVKELLSIMKTSFLRIERPSPELWLDNLFMNLYILELKSLTH